MGCGLGVYTLAVLQTKSFNISSAAIGRPQRLQSVSIDNHPISNNKKTILFSDFIYF